MIEPDPYIIEDETFTIVNDAIDDLLYRFHGFADVYQSDRVKKLEDDYHQNKYLFEEYIFYLSWESCEPCQNDWQALSHGDNLRGAPLIPRARSPPRD